MKLIVGGRAQGKHDFACGVLKTDPKNIVDDVAQRVRTTPESDAVLQALLHEADERTVFVCDEMGCGLVPVDRDERIFRDEYGRVCCALAARCDEVWRVICGIGTRIK
ncbi:MAG: bifunctional adenosylcobinamide kinase/adenosylcobinamide-phosphate guanylyltransferase [Clostridia bacterium]|nr:bifunctional adenosylcobinamide kinase/adenosylcobinamide-phosphate guanylyltransferase [Clostridia bacterium]